MEVVKEAVEAIVIADAQALAKVGAVEHVSLLVEVIIKDVY